VTLQTLAVLAAPFAVGPMRATAGLIVYAVLGLAGAPVFALSFGPTFGYILGFIAVPGVVSRMRTPATGILAGTLAIYGAGVAWLCLWTGTSPWTALVMGVAPFLPADAVKAALVYRFASRSAENEGNFVRSGMRE
jgi:biotin transport system substrate-specific component